MSASQAGRRGFDPRLPLTFHLIYSSGEFICHMPYLAARYLLLIVFIVPLHSCFFNNQSVKNDDGTTASQEYKSGLNALNRDDLIDAEIHFQNALNSRDNFAPALEGLARIQLQRHNPLLTERYLDQAIQADRNWVPAYILKSRLYLVNEDFDLAREELRMAQKRIKKHQLKSFEAEIQPLIAEACFGLGNYESAKIHYINALKQNPEDKRLSDRLEQSKIYSQLLMNKNGRLKTVVRANEMRRGDLALLMRYFLQFAAENQEAEQIRILDLPQDTTLAESIKMCCAANYLPILPDQTFHPEDKVDRAEMALFIERLLNRKYPFIVRLDLIEINDVERYQPFSRAAQLVLTLNLMERDDNQNFRPYDILRGTEALVIVHRLASFLEVPVFPTHFLRNQSGDSKNN